MKLGRSISNFGNSCKNLHDTTSSINYLQRKQLTFANFTKTYDHTGRRLKSLSSLPKENQYYQKILPVCRFFFLNIYCTDPYSPPPKYHCRGFQGLMISNLDFCRSFLACLPGSSVIPLKPTLQSGTRHTSDYAIPLEPSGALQDKVEPLNLAQKTMPCLSLCSSYRSYFSRNVKCL